MTPLAIESLLVLQWQKFMPPHSICECCDTLPNTVRVLLWVPLAIWALWLAGAFHTALVRSEESLGRGLEEP